MFFKTFLCVITGLLACWLAFAQGTVEDYRRANALYGKYAGKVVNADLSPHRVDGEEAFWYVIQANGKREYRLLNAESMTENLLFDHEHLASCLSSSIQKAVDAANMSLGDLRFDAEKHSMEFSFDNRRFRYDILKRELIKVEPRRQGHYGKSRHWMEVDDERSRSEVTSPDGKTQAYIRENNVWVRDVKSGRERALTQNGTEGFYYSSHLQWSPDGRYIAVCRLRPALKHYVHYVESSPRSQLQPLLHKQEYAKPGDELNYKVPCLLDVEQGRLIEPSSTELFERQYALTNLRWDADSRAVTFEYNERGHKVYRVLELSVESGSVRTLIEETGDKYVNYPFLWRHDLEDGRHILWASERDGYRNLYLYDRKTGRPVRQVTHGKWYVRDVVRVDEAGKTIYFSANGGVDNEDPYFIHYYKIGFDGKKLTRLTPSHGTHQAVFSNDYKYLMDTYSTISQAPVTELRSAADGRLLKTVAKADISALKACGWRAPESFCAKGRDGKTDIWGIIVRPSHLDSTRTYPIVEYIYAGPGSQYVPKSFRPFIWDMSNLAELGFIVVQSDGMGTSYRSREFENVCYKNLQDAGFPDRIAWIKAAARKYPYMDTTRVGIFGGSAGGQESMAAVLFHPDFYKAAYSACGCHDNRMDKIWWNELWMGYPVDSSYVRASNVENAHLLKRPLMLVVGELDDNVDPASTMQVANALIKAGKDFELVVLPGEHHTLGGRFGEHKRYDFFVRHLLGVRPPRWDELKP